MARKVEQRKRSISLTLSEANLAAVEKMSDETEFNPSISQIIDGAIAEFLEKRGRAPKLEDKPPRKK